MIADALLDKKRNYLKIFCLLENPLFIITMLYFSITDNLTGFMNLKQER
jgi:hypothetical protein